MMRSINSTTRTCANIRGKRHPHARCTYVATHGEFCSRHWQRPTRWVAHISKQSNPPTTPISSARTTRYQLAAIKRIQKFWRNNVAPTIRRRKGPAAFALNASENRQDIYSFDPVETIPVLYRFSYLDSHNHCWTFDTRFLLEYCNRHTIVKNPFTQESIPTSTLERLQLFTNWLLERKFPTVYLQQDTLSPDQLWTQRILDVCLKFHTLGYPIQIGWFEELSVDDHIDFYCELYDLWNSTLGLSETEKSRIIPGYRGRGRGQQAPLFRWTPTSIETLEHPIKWWRKSTLSLLETFVTKSDDKSLRICGALYCIMALSTVNTHVKDAYPFLSNIPSNTAA